MDYWICRRDPPRLQQGPYADDGNYGLLAATDQTGTTSGSGRHQDPKRMMPFPGYGGFGYDTDNIYGRQLRHTVIVASGSLLYFSPQFSALRFLVQKVGMTTRKTVQIEEMARATGTREKIGSMAAMTMATMTAIASWIGRLGNILGGQRKLVLYSYCYKDMPNPLFTGDQHFVSHGGFWAFCES